MPNSSYKPMHVHIYMYAMHIISPWISKCFTYVNWSCHKNLLFLIKKIVIEYYSDNRIIEHSLSWGFLANPLALFGLSSLLAWEEGRGFLIKRLLSRQNCWCGVWCFCFGFVWVFVLCWLVVFGGEVVGFGLFLLHSSKKKRVHCSSFKKFICCKLTSNWKQLLALITLLKYNGI